MMKAMMPGRRVHVLVGALVWVAAMSAVACDNSVKFSPVQPEWPLEPIGSARNLQISGSLVAEDGSCVEATILFNGKELPGARAECATPNGCERIWLEASTTAKAGHHEVAFRVLRQSAEEIDYKVRGAVRFSSVGLGFGGAGLPLGPERARLQAGDEVIFELELSDF